MWNNSTVSTNSMPIKIAPLSNRFAHTANQLKLVLIKNGEGIVSFNSITTLVKSPMIFCMNENDTFMLPEYTKLEGFIISFCPDIIRHSSLYIDKALLGIEVGVEDIQHVSSLSVFFKRSKSYNGSFFLSIPYANYIYTLIDSMCSPHMQELPSLTTTLMKLLTDIETLIFSSKAFIRTDIGLIEKVIVYLHNNYRNKVSIPTLSKTFHINRTSLSDHFMESTGESIITYLNKHRVNLAILLLETTDFSVTEIAHQVGVNDTPYLAKLFMQYDKEVPTQYRLKAPNHQTIFA